MLFEKCPPSDNMYVLERTFLLYVRERKTNNKESEEGNAREKEMIPSVLCVLFSFGI